MKRLLRWLSFFRWHQIHKSATGKLQQGKLDRKTQAIRRASSAIEEFPLFLGKGVMACNVLLRLHISVLRSILK
jgi:hypothetical protein